MSEAMELHDSGTWIGTDCCKGFCGRQRLLVWWFYLPDGWLVLISVILFSD